MGFGSLMTQFDKSSAQKKAEKQKAQQVTQAPQTPSQTKSVLTGKMVNGHVVDSNGNILDLENGMLGEAKGIVNIYKKYGGKLPDKLDRSDLEAIMLYYSRAGYSELNQYMLHGATPVNESYIKYAWSLMQKACTSQVYNRQKFMLYRGERVNAILEMMGLPVNDVSLDMADMTLQGKSIKFNNKFISTSGKIERAKAFADQDEFASQWGPTLLWKLDASNGIRAIHRTVGAFIDEEEYILPVNTVFQINRCTWDDSDYTPQLVVEAKIVNL